VLQDPTENGIRKALNFGHTLGHAIESYFLENDKKQPLLHGEAVAVGMVLESYISLRRGLIAEHEYSDIKILIKGIFGTVVLEESDVPDLVDSSTHDEQIAND